MLLKFNLQGIERVIKVDPHGNFLPYAPGTQKILAYCSNIGSALLRHVKHAASLDEEGKEAIMDLKSYVEKIELLYAEIRGIDMEKVNDFETFTFEEIPVKKVGVKTRAKKEKPEPTKTEVNPFEGF